MQERGKKPRIMNGWSNVRQALTEVRRCQDQPFVNPRRLPAQSSNPPLTAGCRFCKQTRGPSTARWVVAPRRRRRSSPCTSIALTSNAPSAALAITLATPAHPSRCSPSALHLSRPSANLVALADVVSPPFLLHRRTSNRRGALSQRHMKSVRIAVENDSEPGY